MLLSETRQSNLYRRFVCLITVIHDTRLILLWLINTGVGVLVGCLISRFSGPWTETRKPRVLGIIGRITRNDVWYCRNRIPLILGWCHVCMFRPTQLLPATATASSPDRFHSALIPPWEIPDSVTTFRFDQTLRGVRSSELQFVSCIITLSKPSDTWCVTMPR